MLRLVRVAGFAAPIQKYWSYPKTLFAIAASGFFMPLSIHRQLTFYSKHQQGCKKPIKGCSDLFQMPFEFQSY
jgi:hypothetical protein